MSENVREKAREMLIAQLLKHPDEGVRAMALAGAIPEASIDRVAAALAAKGTGDE